MTRYPKVLLYRIRLPDLLLVVRTIHRWYQQTHTPNCTRSRSTLGGSPGCLHHDTPIDVKALPTKPSQAQPPRKPILSTARWMEALTQATCIRLQRITWSLPRGRRTRAEKDQDTTLLHMVTCRKKLIHKSCRITPFESCSGYLALIPSTHSLVRHILYSR